MYIRNASRSSGNDGRSPGRMGTPMRCMNTKSEVPTCEPTLAMKVRYAVLRSRGTPAEREHVERDDERSESRGFYAAQDRERHVIAAKSICSVSTCVGLRSTTRRAPVKLIPLVPVAVHPYHSLNRTCACESGRHDNGTPTRPAALSVPVQDPLYTHTGEGGLTSKRVVLEGHRTQSSRDTVVQSYASTTAHD